MASGHSPAAPAPKIAVPATAPAPEEMPAAGEPVPRAELLAIDHAELGPLYRVQDEERLLQAHSLLDRFFLATTAVPREQALRELEGLGLDPNLLGRLARVRLHWPALAGGGVYYINERVGPHDVRYFLGVPKDYQRGKPWPLVIRLPTANAFVTQPPPDADGVIAIYTAWLQEERSRHPDAIVLMPLLNLDGLYGPSYSGMNSVIQPLLHAAAKVNIDPARVYMVGHSMSGHAVWNLALHYPTYFASVNPLAGAASADWQRLRLVGLRNVLPVVWHDDDDQVLKVETSKSIVRALRGLKLDVELLETKGVGHAPSPDIAEQAYEMMRGRTRALYPTQVSLQSNRPDTMFNRNDWVQVYQPLTPGPERRLLFRHGSEHMIVYQNTFRIDAKRSENRIEVTTDNVDSMRFYLNDQMVDFSKPISLIVNRKSRFEGMVKPSIEEMLKDQLFLGRGWRYFTGIIDLDLGGPSSATRPASRPSSVTQPTTRRGRITVGPSE